MSQARSDNAPHAMVSFGSGNYRFERPLGPFGGLLGGSGEVKNQKKYKNLDGPVKPVQTTPHMLWFHSGQETTILRGRRDPSEGSWRVR